MIKWIYYSYRNLVYYRKQRKISHQRLMAVVNQSTNTKDTITDAMLATVGLKIVDSDEDKVPWYIPLSKIQKSWVNKTAEFGYKVGLE